VNIQNDALFRTILRRAEAEDLHISFDEGVNWTKVRGEGLDRLLALLADMTSDRLLLRRADGEKVGSVLLVDRSALLHPAREAMQSVDHAVPRRRRRDPMPPRLPRTWMPASSRFTMPQLHRLRSWIAKQA